MAKFLDKTGLDTFWAKIKSTFQTLGNLVTAWGSTPSDTKYPSEKLVKDSLNGKQATLSFDGIYNALTNKAATVSTVTNAIGGLDVSSVGGNGKYISAISETDGKISATETNIDDALSATSAHPVQNKELTRWHNIVIGEDGFVSGSSANPQLSLQKSRLGALSLYNAGVNIKIYSFDENDEENASLEWDVSTASDSIKASYNKGGQTGTLYQSTAGKWVKILYTGTTSSYFRALGVFMDTRDSSSSVSNFYGHLRIGGVDYPESAQFSTWGSLVVAAYSKSSTTTVELILRPKSATCMCRIFGFRCLNTYTGSDAILIGKASSAFTTDKLSTARKLKTNLARTADSTFDGSANQENIPVTGTLPLGNGGTGKTTAKAAEYNLTTGKSEISDATSGDDRVVFELASPSESNGVTRGFRKLSTIWTWIKGLLSSESGVNISGSSASCTGNAATASAAQSGSALETAINGKMNTSASNATAPSSSGGDGATATLLNNLTDGNSDIATTDDGDNVLIATTDNRGTVTNKWYKRKLIKLIPWIIKKLGTRLVYDCGAGSTSGDDFDAALAAFNAGQWVIIHKDSNVYYCVGTFQSGLRFRKLSNSGTGISVSTLNWTRESAPTSLTQLDASLSGHTHSQYLTASDITGKMATDCSNKASGALQNLTGQLTEGTSDFTDNTEMFTSYAGNNGFAESGHVNQPYRRKASSMLNYVRDGFAIDRSPANVGTTHKRISLGYGKYNSSGVGAMTYIVRLFFNYADEGGLVGKGITVLVTYDFRFSSLQKSECRILSDNGVRDAGYNVVLANYISGSGDNGKLYICIGLVKNSAPTTLVSFNYSYCKIFRVSTIGDWTQDISSDAVGTYNYLVQATDLVSNAVNADMVDGKHIVIGSWAGASNTIYFG